MALYKQKNSPYWWVKIYVSPGNIVRESTQTTDKKIAQAYHDERDSVLKENLKKQRLNKLLGKEPEPIHKTFPMSELHKRSNDLKQFTDNQHKYWKPFYKWFKGNYNLNMDASDFNKAKALEYMTIQYGNLSSKSYNNAKSGLSAIWRSLAIYDISNIWLVIPNKTGNSKKFRALSDREVTELLKNSSGYWKQLILIGYYTGIRLKDICFLEWSDIYDEYIELIPNKTKRYKRAVYIHLHPSLKELFKSIDKTSSSYVFPLAARQYNSGMFERTKKEMFDNAKIYATKYGIVGFHSLRATFITNAEKYGIPTSVIQGIVGHKSPHMTKHYSEDNSGAKALERLPKLTMP